MLGELFDMHAVAVRIGYEVLPLDEALPAQGVEQGGVPRRGTRAQLQASQAIGPARILRMRSQGKQRRATDRPDEFPSPHVLPQAEDCNLGPLSPT